MERSGNGPTDGMWRAVGEFPSGGAGDPGVTAADGRPFVGAILRRVRTGVPRRGLPGRFGKCGGVSGRRRRRVPKGVTDRIFGAPPGDLDLDHPFVDGAVTPAHRKAAGGKEAPGERRRMLPRSPGRQGPGDGRRARPSRGHRGASGSGARPAGAAGADGGPVFRRARRRRGPRRGPARRGTRRARGGGGDSLPREPEGGARARRRDVWMAVPDREPFREDRGVTGRRHPL